MTQIEATFLYSVRLILHFKILNTWKKLLGILYNVYVIFHFNRFPASHSQKNIDANGAKKIEDRRQMSQQPKNLSY